MQRRHLVESQDELLSYVREQCAYTFHRLHSGGDIQQTRDDVEILVAQIGPILLSGELNQNNQEQLRDIHDQLVDLASAITIDHIPDVSSPSASDSLSPEDVACLSQPLMLDYSTGGRPSLIVPPELLSLLVDLFPRLNQVAEIMGISERTLRRRMRAYGIEKHTTITDEQLETEMDNLFKGTQDFARNNIGFRQAWGMLVDRGIRVPFSRVRKHLRTISPVHSTLRWSRANFHRGKYSVKGPMHLFHGDTHHKLIDYGIVTHGWIDGASRFVVELHATDNNLAVTALTCFQHGIAQLGTLVGQPDRMFLPSRTRVDGGSENVLVKRFMEEQRGEGRGSCIVGRSVHNQRIERLWRDVFTSVIEHYWVLFHTMEDMHILERTNQLHLYVLHRVYLPHINNGLATFRGGWNNHRLSGVNRSPWQMMVPALLSWGRTPLEEVESNVLDLYGIDWGGAVPEPDTGVVLPPLRCPLDEYQKEELERSVDFARHSDFDYVDIYLEAVAVVMAL